MLLVAKNLVTSFLETVHSDRISNSCFLGSGLSHSSVLENTMESGWTPPSQLQKTQYGWQIHNEREEAFQISLSFHLHALKEQKAGPEMSIKFMQYWACGVQQRSDGIITGSECSFGTEKLKRLDGRMKVYEVQKSSWRN